MEIVIPQNREVFGGYFAGLETCKIAAQTYGNTVTVLEPFECAAVNEFRELYAQQHNSPNPLPFERWCFEQWLYLSQWMDDNDKDVVFKIDCDTLVFTDMGRFYVDNGKPRGTDPAPDSFVTQGHAAEIRQAILSIFRDGKAQKWCSWESDNQHVADNAFIRKINIQRHLPDLACPERTEIIDNGLFNTFGEERFEGHKDILFVNGQPVWLRRNGITRMLTLHCWGPAKTKLAKVWEQSRQSFNNPTRLKLE